MLDHNGAPFLSGIMELEVVLQEQHEIISKKVIRAIRSNYIVAWPVYVIVSTF